MTWIKSIKSWKLNIFRNAIRMKKLMLCAEMISFINLINLFN